MYDIVIKLNINPIYDIVRPCANKHIMGFMVDDEVMTSLNDSMVGNEMTVILLCLVY